jgi:MFS family permease
MNANANNHSPLSPRFAGAIFFAIYSLLFTLFTKYTLLSLRDKALLPLLPSIFIALIIGALVGAILGKALVKKAHWLRPFLIGILLAFLILILGSLAILTHYYFSDPIFVSRLQHAKDYFVVYGAILASLSLTIGLWFIPLSGLVAIYFNKHFFPGLIAADQQRIKNKNHNDAPNDE